jgi:hypothetical protein
MNNTTKLGLGGLAALVVAGAVACASPAVTQAPQSAAPAAQASHAPTSAAPSPSPSDQTSGSVGTTFEVTDSQGNKYDVTLVKVIDPAQGADSFSTPDNGKRFVGAVLTIKGVSGSSSDDTNSDAVVTGSNGQQYQADFNNIQGYTNFNSGSFNVSPGQTVTGAVNFQVPTGVSVHNVQWVPNAFTGTAGTWNVG